MVHKEEGKQKQPTQFSKNPKFFCPFILFLILKYFQLFLRPQNNLEPNILNGRRSERIRSIALMVPDFALVGIDKDSVYSPAASLSTGNYSIFSSEQTMKLRICGNLNELTRNHLKST